jgi:hypothetical protein
MRRYIIIDSISQYMKNFMLSEFLLHFLKAIADTNIVTKNK